MGSRVQEPNKFLSSFLTRVIYQLRDRSQADGNWHLFITDISRLEDVGGRCVVQSKPLSGRKDSSPQLYRLPEDHLQLTALFGNYLGWRKLSCPRFHLPEAACTQWLIQLGNTKAWPPHCNLGQVCGVAEASVGTALLLNLSLYPICVLFLPSTGINPKSTAL